MQQLWQGRKMVGSSERTCPAARARLLVEEAEVGRSGGGRGV
jgi:hypothetical protein